VFPHHNYEPGNYVMEESMLVYVVLPNSGSLWHNKH